MLCVELQILRNSIDAVILKDHLTRFCLIFQFSKYLIYERFAKKNENATNSNIHW